MDLYEMELHEKKVIDGPFDNVVVLRVPGGWVYFREKTSCFVPLDNEFQK